MYSVIGLLINYYLLRDDHCKNNNGFQGNEVHYSCVSSNNKMYKIRGRYKTSGQHYLLHPVQPTTPNYGFGGKNIYKYDTNIIQ